MTPSLPYNLAVCRIGFYASMLAVALPNDYARWALAPKLIADPLEILGLFSLPLGSEMVLDVLQVGWKVLLLACAVGLGGAIVRTLAALLGWYLLTLPAGFGFVSHDTGLPAIMLFVMAIARTNDVWSLDARLAPRDVAPSSEYTWPIVLARVLLTLVFCASGIAKLRASGLAWATSDNLQMLLVRHHFSHEPMVEWGLTFAQSPLVSKALGFATLFFEVFAPLALWRPLRWLMLGTFGMQLGIGLLLGVWFELYLGLYLFWIDWEALLRRTRHGKRWLTS
jgi:hypothetical protein